MSSSPTVRAGKDVVLAVTEGLWAAAFRLGGRLASTQVRHWSSPGTQDILVLAPHPDDEALGCSGTLLRHRAAGDRVRLVHITDGRRSQALSLNPDAMANRRLEEAEAAATLLEAEHVWMGLPEGAWDVETLEVRLARVLIAFPPHVIYAPSRVDYHPEHIRVAHGLARTLDRSPSAAFACTVRVFQSQVPLTARLVNLVTDVQAQDAQIKEIAAAYVTQRNSVRRSLRMRRYAAGRHRLAGWAEEFWEMTADRYRGLHRHVDFSAMATPYRALRAQPFTDPLAYLVGGSARRRIAREGRS